MRCHNMFLRREVIPKLSLLLFSGELVFSILSFSEEEKRIYRFYTVLHREKTHCWKQL